MYTMDELSYIADQISREPGAFLYDDVMAAMRQVRDAALEDIAALEAERDAARQERDNRQAIIERMATGINTLTAERDDLRRQVAAAQASLPARTIKARSLAA